MEIKINDKFYKVVRTAHLKELRSNGLKRDENISERYLEEILKLPLEMS